MTHGEAAHGAGTHNMFTGYKPSPAIKFPSFGSVVSHGTVPQNLPPYVCVPNVPNEFAEWVLEVLPTVHLDWALTQLRATSR